MPFRTAVCSVDGCDRDHYGLGFCRLHYKRHKAGIAHTPCVVCGAPTAKAGKKFCSGKCRMVWHRKYGCYRPEREIETRGACAIDGCGKPVHANGYCRPHSIRLWRNGDPLVIRRRIQATECIQCFEPRVKGEGAKDLCGRCYANAYYHGNLEAERARRNSRRRYLVERTPAWADREAIRRIYAMCPKGYEVDHIIPIRGRRVSGLHVEGNLQYLTNTENKRKLNSFECR